MRFHCILPYCSSIQELFYLLADTEHETVEQGGVVTVGSLAVELQAGGCKNIMYFGQYSYILA